MLKGYWQAPPTKGGAHLFERGRYGDDYAPYRASFFFLRFFRKFFPGKNLYRAGKTNNVRMVEDIIPPMTTVASGLCTSEPAPTLKAIGTNPREATSAVIRTGLRRVKAPSIIASSSALPLACKSRMKEII